MSVEFEKIVLEKFDELNSKINGLSEELHETKGKVETNTNLINNLSIKVKQVEEKVDNNTDSINNLSVKIQQVEEKVDQHSLNFAEFENEFTIKIQALFDSFVSKTESHSSYEKSIAVLHAKTYKHDNKISVLEDYFKGTKLLANN